ncbi:Cilia- and flagella-associated protein 57 [Nowakowskiella sp. JEL0407]|nr:Cilia- and flagella-associated protein 57 [Nowakowskiella sp. JEL0407]
MTCMSYSVSNGLGIVAVKGERPAIVQCDFHTMKKKRIFQAPEGIQAKEYVSICFSSDGKHFLGQSAGPDWMIYYWTWEKPKLISSIRSTNHANSEIHQISCNPFDTNTQVCVTGLNLYKTFKFSEGAFKPLHQHKPDHNLFCHSWVNDIRIISGTEDGKLLVFEGADLIQEISYVNPRNDLIESSINSIIVLSGGLLVGTSTGTCILYEKMDDHTLYKVNKEFYLEGSGKVATIAISPSEEFAVCTLKNSQIYQVLLDADTSRADEIKCERLSQPFHYGFVIGLDTCARKPLIATCGTDKSIRIWNTLENTVEVVKYCDDEPQSIAFHPSGLYVLVGFNDSLTLMNVLIDDIRPFWHANIRGCRECHFSNGGQYFAAVHGSTINIHSTWSFESICHLKGHQGKVRSISWSQDDSHIVSCGMDGALFEWNIRTMKREIEINLNEKGLIFTSACHTPDSKLIYAVGSDCTLKEISDGHASREIPTKVQYTHLVISRSNKMMFAATARGTVRALKYPIPTEGASEYVEVFSHSAPITRLRISYDDQHLFTCSEDGSVSVYRVQDREAARINKREKDFSYSDEILITKSDLKDNFRLMSEYKQRVEDLKLENELQLRSKGLNYTEKLRELTEKYMSEIEGLKQLTLSIKQERENNEANHNKELTSINIKNKQEMKEIELNFASKMDAEAEKYFELESRVNFLEQQWLTQIEEMDSSHQQKVADTTAFYQQKLKEKSSNISELKGQLQQQRKDFVQMTKEVEEDTENEVVQIQHGFETKLREEQQSLSVIRNENNEMKKKYEMLTKDIEDHKTKLNKMFTEERKLHGIIKGFEKDIMGVKREMQERDDTIQDKEKRIYDLKKKNQELEKFKFVLDYKIMELKKQIEPREKDIEALTDQIKDMDTELQNYHKGHANLDTVIQDMNLKLQAATRESISEQWRAREIKQANKRIQADVKSLYTSMKKSDLNTFKASRDLVAIYRKYDKVSHEPEDPSRELINSLLKMGTTWKDEKILSEFESETLRQRVHLEGTVSSLRFKVHKTEESQHNDNLRLVKENISLVNEINTLRKDLKYTNARTKKIMEKIKLKKNRNRRSEEKPPLQDPSAANNAEDQMIDTQKNSAIVFL